jgi:hypothetical protein
VKECPNCGFKDDDLSIECPKCGIIHEKYFKKLWEIEKNKANSSQTMVENSHNNNNVALKGKIPPPNEKIEAIHPKSGLSGKSKGAEKLATYITIGIVLLIFIASLNTKSNKSSSRKTDTAATKSYDAGSRNIEAYNMMETFVKKRLKSPSKAEFPGVFDGKVDHVTYDGMGVYNISSYVDSQNSFGATIRTRFSGSIEDLGGGRWKLISLNFY